MFYLVSRSTCLILSALLLLSGVVWSISDDEDDISGSGSASGSGSGFVSGYEPDSECIPPSNDTVMLQQFSLSFEDVIAVSRCYSACLETVRKYYNNIIIVIMMYFITRSSNYYNNTLGYNHFMLFIVI